MSGMYIDLENGTVTISAATICLSHPDRSEIKEGEMVENFLKKPMDYREPDWTPPERGFMHDWKEYVPPTLQQMWPSFTDEQKRKISEELQLRADQEDWDFLQGDHD